MTSNGGSTTGVALYLRVSTEEQDLDGQERELRAYAAVRGWMIVGVYREKVSATGRVAREQFRQLAADSGSPERGWGHVLVWALDRWSRETFVQAIGEIQELEKRGVLWHSFKEPFLDSPEDGAESMTRELLRAILPTIARFESMRRSERTRLAMKEIKEGRRPTRSGRPPGRQPRVTSEQVNTAVALRARGLPYRDIAQRVRLPVGTCRRVVSLHLRGLPAFVTPPVRKGQAPGGDTPRE